jgi:hypothetical protein
MNQSLPTKENEDPKSQSSSLPADYSESHWKRRREFSPVVYKKLDITDVNNNCEKPK